MAPLIRSSKPAWITGETQALLEGIAKQIPMLDASEARARFVDLAIRSDGLERDRGAGHGKGEHHKTGT
jgi:hypothetical protein